jgi:predicted membrane GTPase involved in stress response
MTPATQVKLLRVLQERTFRRLGGRQEQTVDVRIIAATNMDPHDAVVKGKLRERLELEWRRNVSIRVEDTDSPDLIRVTGRGELQLGILIETMRREGYELAVSRPKVLIRRNEKGEMEEPIDEVECQPFERDDDGPVGAVAPERSRGDSHC